MPKIFINYRRDDAVYAASHLHQDLAAYFGSQNVFWDQQSLKGGVRYDPVIVEALDSCKILIALIGPDWMRITQERLLTPDRRDYARWEISTAFKRLSYGPRSPITIIPLLVGGAEVPPLEDLPDDLKQLFENTVHKLRSSESKEDPGLHKLRALEWKEDLAALVRLIEGALETDYRYSLVGGAVAGSLTAIIAGVPYYLANQNNPNPKDRVELARIIVGGVFGIVAGLVFSWCINRGVGLFSKWLNYADYSKIIGGVLGGTAGGLAACVIAGISFATLSGGGAEPGHIILAVAISTICIVLGMIWPDMKSGWWEKFITTVILVSVTFTAVKAAEYFLDNQVKGLKNLLEEGKPFSKGVLILGALCGIMAGLQSGMALFLYDRRRKY